LRRLRAERVGAKPLDLHPSTLGVVLNNVAIDAARTWAANDFNGARAWVESLGDDRLASSAASGLASVWIGVDPEAALAWADQFGHESAGLASRYVSLEAPDSQTHAIRQPLDTLIAPRVSSEKESTK